MLRASCLCGAVTWSVEGKLRRASACYCTMCRKVHGTAYGAYADVAPSGFRWNGGEDQILSYRSSPRGTRPFCERCGSTVANPSADPTRVEIPLGPLEGAKVDVKLLAHIFVDTKPPWYEISDALPQFEAWPPGYDLPVQPTPERVATSRSGITGSCLCGQVAYEVSPALVGMRHCHCSRCRKARAAPHASNAFCNLASFRFTKGEAALRTWKVPEAQFFSQTFCTTCGSPMPRVDPSRDLVVIPGGSLDDDPRVRPSEHIFVGSKASWLEITDALPQRFERT